MKQETVLFYLLHFTHLLVTDQPVQLNIRDTNLGHDLDVRKL